MRVNKQAWVSARNDAWIDAGRAPSTWPRCGACTAPAGRIDSDVQCSGVESRKKSCEVSAWLANWLRKKKEKKTMKKLNMEA